MVKYVISVTGIQWRRDEFESGDRHVSGAKRRRKFFWSCPSTFLALKVQLVVLVSFFALVNRV